jgi:hypothetical protein
MGQLSAMRIKALTEPGRYTDGDGLMLIVKESGAKSWMLRVRIEGERRDIGLGSLKVVTLAQARAKAIELRRDIARGIDPIAEKKKVEDPVPNFRDAAHVFTPNTKRAGRTASIRRNGLARSKPMRFRCSVIARSTRSKDRISVMSLHPFGSASRKPPAVSASGSALCSIGAM